MTSPTLRLGTRGSTLARAQADLVAELWRGLHNGIPVELEIIHTQGDADQTTPLSILGGQGVFTSALQNALLSHTIDAAVHSAKDLPSLEPAELDIAAFLSRENPRDVLISRHGTSLADLPPHPRIGTSSRRRHVLVKAARPDAEIVELRGNIDTRLRKAMDGDLDGAILAAAGLHRLGWQDRITAYLPVDQFIPAPGQAAIAVETRRDDIGPAVQMSALDDPPTSAAVRIERAFLRAIGAGCTTPVSAYAEVDGDSVRLRAMLASEDLQRVEWADETLPLVGASETAGELARTMLARVGDPSTVSGPAGDRQ